MIFKIMLNNLFKAIRKYKKSLNLKWKLFKKI